MKNLFTKSLLVITLTIPTMLSASQLKGLNVIVTSAEPQTQMMAMVLSTMAIKKHKKMVNITLCGPAGDLAVKGMKSTPIKRPDGKSPTPKMALKGLIKAGAKVQVCPLYLPNAGKDKSVLLDGITVAKPPMVAAKLLNDDFNNLTF
ncbi:hypothetical protein ACKGJI_00470 [Sulfurospirillum sp. 1307]